MKALLEFNLPDEEEEHKNAVNGTAWRGVVQDLDGWLRGKLKYGDTVSKELDEARTQLHSLAQARGLDVHD